MAHRRSPVANFLERKQWGTLAPYSTCTDESMTLSTAQTITSAKELPAAGSSDRAKLNRAVAAPHRYAAGLHGGSGKSWHEDAPEYHDSYPPMKVLSAPQVPDFGDSPYKSATTRRTALAFSPLAALKPQGPPFARRNSAPRPERRASTDEVVRPRFRVAMATLKSDQDPPWGITNRDASASPDKCGQRLGRSLASSGWRTVAHNPSF